MSHIKTRGFVLGGRRGRRRETALFVFRERQEQPCLPGRHYTRDGATASSLALGYCSRKYTLYRGISGVRLVKAKLEYGSLSVEATGVNQPMLVGNSVSLFTGGLYSLVDVPAAFRP
ncbi:hypothetical protein B0T14DRAFT_138288 [Immersiella caudata]|uniref:Uncharacterized protein n=1 Tax=Immersiella caudata TaxID=314043 RepID=A0AA39X598_9PEZI|nr:hypothetical protein B0T14DRAFT_138288 [Immersiella caudata]